MAEKLLYRNQTGIESLISIQFAWQPFMQDAF